MVLPTILLLGYQIHCHVVCITLAYSITVHGAVTYVNTLINDTNIDVIICFYIICVAFSNELIKSFSTLIGSVDYNKLWFSQWWFSNGGYCIGW